MLQFDSALAESKADVRLNTRSTFHAARFWLNAGAELNAYEPNHTRSTPTERPRTCGADTFAPNHTHPLARTHMDATGGYVYVYI